MKTCAIEKLLEALDYSQREVTPIPLRDLYEMAHTARAELALLETEHIVLEMDSDWRDCDYVEMVRAALSPPTGKVLVDHEKIGTAIDTLEGAIRDYTNHDLRDNRMMGVSIIVAWLSALLKDTP